MLSRRVFDWAWLRRSDEIRTFAVAAWIGWQIESNWADPFLFAVYSIVRPIAGVMILVMMYSVVTHGALQQPMFAYIYLGNALYMLAGQVITGVSWAVVDDREHYHVTKHLHITPMDGFYYLMGRGVARLIIATISVIIVIGFGMLVFHLPIHLGRVDWPLLLGSTALGVLSLAGLGMIIGAWTMSLARHFWSLGEALAGGIYLFTGAIFPLDVLPAWIRPLGFILPVTYWLEVARRALLGGGAPGFQTLAGLSNLQLVVILAVFTVVTLTLAKRFYRISLRRAKESGRLDMETAY